MKIQIDNQKICGINRIAERFRGRSTIQIQLRARSGVRKDATLSCPLGYQHFEEGAKLLDSDKNAKPIATFQWLSRGKSRGFSCDINRIAREDVALQCFEEGAKLLDSDKNSKLITTFQWLSRGKSGGFLV